MKQNYFIVVEGGEGTGKTTFCELLKEKLKEIGYRVVITREPGGTILGEKIRKMVLEDGGLSSDVEGVLFAAARNHHFKQIIQPNLKSKTPTIVLCDRYLLSGIVYQGYVPNGDDGARYQEKINEECIPEVKTGEAVPDVTFLLDCDPVIALDRIIKNNREMNRFDQKPVEFHSRVRKGFKKYLNDYSKFGYIVDVSGKEPNGVVENAFGILKEKLKEQNKKERED